MNITEVEVRYKETDQMGVVYHANYLVWFEIGRTKFIENLGFTYLDMEKEGLILPVTDVKASYKTPIKYGDRVIIETVLKKYTGIRLQYEYIIKNGEGKVAVLGTTDHGIVKQGTFKPVRLRSIRQDWHDLLKNATKGE